MKPKKIYDRDTQKWVDDTDSFRKKRQADKCKKGAKHDWHDSLPYGVNHPNPTPEIIEKYYNLTEARDKLVKSIEEETEDALKLLGLESKYRSGSFLYTNRSRRQLCHNCGKTKGW